MSRSIWKKPFSLSNRAHPLELLMNNLSSSNKNLSDGKSSHKGNDNEKKRSNFLYHKTQEKTLEIWSRSCMLLPEHLGKNIKIYNGKSWAFRKVAEQMVGHKFGEFCSTRKKTIHKFSIKKKVNKKK